MANESCQMMEVSQETIQAEAKAAVETIKEKIEELTMWKSK